MITEPTARWLLTAVFAAAGWARRCRGTVPRARKAGFLLLATARRVEAATKSGRPR